MGGYLLGNLIPDIESRIHLVVAVVIALSLLPPAIALLRGYLGRKAKPIAPPSPTDLS